MSNIVVDDTDPSLTYSGNWNLFSGGSSRQWQSTVHSTFQTGATVSFRFRGSVCMVYGTIPLGNGSQILMDVTIDGSVSPSVSRTSSSAAVYANLFFQSSSMASDWHTVVITNRGGAGNLDFEFDRVELDANDILPTVAAFSPAPSSQTSPSSTSSTLPNTSGSPNPMGTVTSSTATSIANTLSGTPSSSQPPQGSTQSMSTGIILTQIVTTTRKDGSVVTSEITLLPNATTQASSGSTHTVPASTVIGIVGGVAALLVLILLLILCLRRRKANNHRFALMGVSNDYATQNMSQNRTTVATPFTLGPSSLSSVDLSISLGPPTRLPLSSTTSGKALLQQAHANRSENDPGTTSTPIPTLFSPLSVTASSSVSTPNSTHATDGISNSEAPISKSLPIDSSPLSDSPISSADTGYQLQHLSGSTSIAGPSTRGRITSIYDGPPAYQPNE